MTDVLRTHMAPSFDAIRELRTQLAAWLYHTMLSSERQNDVVLAASELCSNVVRHSSPRPSYITVELSDASGAYELRVCDDGGTFVQYHETTQRAGACELASTVGESGMGIPLVATLFPRQRYIPAQPDAGRRENQLILYIDSNVAPAAMPRVAVVDDDESLRELLKLYLSEQFDVVTYVNGVEALKALCHAPVDLVLSDIRMPEMDGFELRRRLARHPATELIPFVFLTGDTADQTRVDAAGLAIDDYLLKSVRRHELCICVARVINRAAQLRQRIGDRLDRAITATLRPALPEQFGRYRAVVGSRTATAGGGDFISLRSNRSGYSLIIGDIMGHGEQAKFFAHAHAGFFVGLFQGAHAGDDPGKWLDALSQASANNSLLEATLVTCLGIQLGNDGVVTIASAGHPPPLIIRPEGITTVEIGGNLPSLDIQTPHDQCHFDLGSGRLFLYTDGLLEGASDATTRRFLRESLTSILEKTRGCPMQDMADTLLAAFDLLTKDAPSDDATFVLIERIS